MPFPDLDYVSMQEAVSGFEFKISIERLRGLIEEGYLPAYVHTPSAEIIYSNIRLHKFAKVCGRIWWKGETLYLYPEGKAWFEIRSETGETVKNLSGHGHSFHSNFVRVSPKELRALQEIQSKASKASKALTERRTAERDKFVEEIMDKINQVVKIREGNTMIINHIRVIREAEVPEKMFNSVKQQVALRIKEDYGPVGYKALSRAPKKKEIEPYLLPS